MNRSAAALSASVASLPDIRSRADPVSTLRFSVPPAFRCEWRSIVDAKMRWFQYRNGVAGQRHRVAHCEDQSAGGGTWSWCRHEFSPTEVEEVAEPGAVPETEQAMPGAPCVPCLMLVMGATADGAASGTELGEAHDAPIYPFGDVPDDSAAEAAGTVSTVTATEEAAEECPPKTVLAISMLKAQWLLDDAAHDISGGRYSTAQAIELVDTLEELTRLMRETIGDGNR